VEVSGRWRDSVAACGEHCDEATVRAFKRWVRLTGGPSPISGFLRIFKHPNFEIQNCDLPTVYNSPSFA
jgi:hypothetical protein